MAVVFGLINVLDILTDIVAIGLANVSVIELGLLNSIGYLSYIPSLLIGGWLSEKGIIRKQILVVLASTVLYGLSMTLFTTRGWYLGLLLCYLTYPVSIAFIRTSVYAYIHECYASNMWRTALTLRFIATSLSEAVALISISHVIRGDLVTPVLAISTLSTVILTTSLIIVKDPALRIERVLYRVESTIEYIEGSLKDFLMYTTLSENSTYWSRIPKRVHRPTCSLKLVIAALLGFKLGTAILLVPLPSILTTRLGISLQDVVKIYGGSRLVVLLTMLWKNHYRLRPLLYLGRIVLWYALLKSTSDTVATLLFGLILCVNGDVDVVLYSTYLKVTRGRGVSRYILLGDAALAVGSAISGYVYGGLGMLSIIPVFVLSMPGAILMMFS